MVVSVEIQAALVKAVSVEATFADGVGHMKGWRVDLRRMHVDHSLLARLPQLGKVVCGGFEMVAHAKLLWVVGGVRYTQ